MQTNKFVVVGPTPEQPAERPVRKPRPSELSAPPPVQPGLLDAGRTMHACLENVNKLTTLYLEGKINNKTYITRMVALQDSPEWRLAVWGWSVATKAKKR